MIVSGSGLRTLAMTLDEKEPAVLIEENAPRDGIQNEPSSFSPGERIELVNALSGCGFKRIQIGALVSPRRVPQMAETEKVLEGIDRYPGVTYSVLVLNRRGLDRAISTGFEHVSIFVSASETHSRENSNCSVDEATIAARSLIEHAKSRGLTVQAGVMNAFGCRSEGKIPLRRVLNLVGDYSNSGADEVNLADTSGVAHPKQMEEMIASIADLCDLPLSLHLHDTYGFGLANVYAAWRSGVRRFDACCGGLGGCPFIAGAAGNVATEDVVHLFESMGVTTGISLACLAKVVRRLETKMERRLPGRYAGSCGSC
jgi:hydroxymethylglutaryl-CoA lyase